MPENEDGALCHTPGCRFLAERLDLRPRRRRILTETESFGRSPVSGYDLHLA